MIKLLYLSGIIALVLVPIQLSKRKSARAGLRHTLTLLLAFNFFYFLAVLYGYFHFGVNMDPKQALKSVRE